MNVIDLATDLSIPRIYLSVPDSSLTLHPTVAKQFAHITSPLILTWVLVLFVTIRRHHADKGSCRLSRQYLSFSDGRGRPAPGRLRTWCGY